MFNTDSRFQKNIAIGLGALVAMNALPIIGLSLLALIAHFMLLICIGDLFNQIGGCLKWGFMPIMGIAWLWFFMVVVWELTLGLIF